MTRAMIELQIGLFALLLLVTSITRGHAASSESLIDAAKREGEVVYYASMNLSEANAIVAEFEKRYPFIKVKLQRTGSEKLLSRVLTEFRAKKIFADVINLRQEPLEEYIGAPNRGTATEKYWWTATFGVNWNL